jgi:hypothetical protein
MGIRSNLPTSDHKVGYIMELDQGAYFSGGFESFNHKIMSENEKNVK